MLDGHARKLFENAIGPPLQEILCEASPDLFCQSARPFSLSTKHDSAVRSRD